jgi:hypothetical protein
MSGAELVALIAIIGTTTSALLTTCFHSRCTNITTPCISCDRVLMDEVEAKPVS